MKKIIFPGVLISLFLSFIGSDTFSAQKPDAMDLVKKYSESAKKNIALMMKYSWKMRIQLTIKGESKDPILYHMRFDTDGKLQRTLLTMPKPKKKRRGLRKRIAQRKIAELKEWAGKLSDLIKKYTMPTPGTMLDFYMKANFILQSDGLLRIHGRDFLQQGDSVTYWHDSQSQQLKRYSFDTNLEGDDVQVAVEYGLVSSGPAYAARMIVKIPVKQIEAKIENFDFIKQ